MSETVALAAAGEALNRCGERLIVGLGARMVAASFACVSMFAT